MATRSRDLIAVKARQGETGHGVRYVLGLGVALAVLALTLAYALAL